MITEVQLGSIHGRDGDVNEHIRKLKEVTPNYKVIDIGASANFWCEHVTAAVDIVDLGKGDVSCFTGNINLFEVWSSLLVYVDKYGKFDFSICTHTLEDISNPYLVAQMLTRIAKRGFVAVPSKHVECKRVGAMTGCRGWLHHRWIFNYEKNKVVGYPKLPFTEYLESLDKVAEQGSSEELSFYWEDSCDIEIVNNDYFPSEEAAVRMYDALID